MRWVLAARAGVAESLVLVRLVGGCSGDASGHLAPGILLQQAF
jgi:hypothetical protein